MLPHEHVLLRRCFCFLLRPGAAASPSYYTLSVLRYLKAGEKRVATSAGCALLNTQKRIAVTTLPPRCWLRVAFGNQRTEKAPWPLRFCCDHSHRELMPRAQLHYDHERGLGYVAPSALQRTFACVCLSDSRRLKLITDHGPSYWSRGFSAVFRTGRCAKLNVRITLPRYCAGAVRFGTRSIIPRWPSVVHSVSQLILV
jgi:hypothetical protein